MDFDRELNSLNDTLRIQGEEWYRNVKSLRDKALQPDSIKISGEYPIAVEYEAAINWYNFKRESHLIKKQSVTFASFIALGWEKTKPDVKKNVLHWKVLEELGIEGKFQKALSGKGTKISEKALREKIGDYLITFISEVNLPQKRKSSMDSFEPLHPDPVKEEDAGKIIRTFLEDESPVAWCSSLKAIENDIQKTKKFNEIAQRLGMSHAPTSLHHPYKFYGIKILTGHLIEHLKFPTVADARLFHVFEPSREDIGFTLDLRNGEPSLPEVVIRRDILKKAYEADPDIFEVEICKAHGAKRNQNTWVLTDTVGCTLKHQKNRLERVRREVSP